MTGLTDRPTGCCGMGSGSLPSQHTQSHTQLRQGADNGKCVRGRKLMFFGNNGDMLHPEHKKSEDVGVFLVLNYVKCGSEVINIREQTDWNM